MRDADGRLAFSPRLPEGLRQLGFRVLHRGSVLEVVVRPQEATYTVVRGGPVDTCHHGEEFTVEHGSPRTLPIEPLPEQPRPQQPRHRDPRGLRRAHSGG